MYDDDVLETLDREVENALLDAYAEARIIDERRRVEREIEGLQIQIAVQQSLTEIYAHRLHPRNVPTAVFSLLASKAHPLEA